MVFFPVQEQIADQWLSGFRGKWRDLSQKDMRNFLECSISHTLILVVAVRLYTFVKIHRTGHVSSAQSVQPNIIAMGCTKTKNK